MPLVAKDEQLPVAAARAGDPAAWDILFHRFQLPLYAYVQELIRHEQTSLDIVQETFIKAVRHGRSLRDDARFGSWLFRIAHQLCQQHWRKSRPTESLDEAAETDFANPTESPDRLLVSAEQQELFLTAIGQLPEEHRSVVLLHYLEDFDLAEIADITGVPLGTVKSRLHHARRKLREQLASEFRP
ncbi:sigma-70 family RNA polymerase sigma factor [bacterium]|nr:sigma-70 family RNA polymerase sigma factor [bacterium]